MEQKKKRGRPTTENPRSRQVGVWMNEVEYQQFLAAGGCAGVRKLLAQAAKEKASVDALAKVALGGQPGVDKEKEIVA